MTMFLVISMKLPQLIIGIEGLKISLLLAIHELILLTMFFAKATRLRVYIKNAAWK